MNVVVRYFYIASMLFTSLIISQNAQADTLPTMGNGERVIADVSGALENSDNKEVRSRASGAKALALTGLRQKGDCDKNKSGVELLPEDVPQHNLTPERSPIDGTALRPDDTGFFFNFQYLATGQNGQTSFQSTSIPRINASNVIGSYANANGMTRQQVLAMSDADFKQMLRDNAPNGLSGQALEDTVNNAFIIARMSQFETVDAAMSFASGHMRNANFGQKVNFLANYLSYMNDNYENDMINGGPTVGQDRWDQDLHSAMGTTILTGEEMPAGVCRHMHQMAVRMARRMGIDEAFGVGYRTAGGGHRTMVLTHPDDPTKVVQVNYGKVSTNEGVGGPAALTQNHTLPSSGIRFRIYNGEDRPAIILPSELGGILNRVTGGEDSDLGQNYTSDAQIQQVGVSTPYGTVRIFRATTPTGSGEEVVGGAYNVRVDYNDIFYGEYGIAGFHSERASEQGGMTQSGGYAQMTQGYNWQFYTSDKLNIRTFGELHARVAVYCAAEGDDDCEVNSDYNIDGQVGLSADYRTGPLWHRTSLIGQFQFDQAHANNGNAPAVILPTVSLTHDMYFKLADEVVGNVGGGVTMYNLGTGQYLTYNGHLGVDSQRTGTSLLVESTGRITNDTPFWLPDAQHMGSIQARQNIFGEHLYVGVEGRQSFDVLNNNYLGFTIGGRF